MRGEVRLLVALAMLSGLALTARAREYEVFELSDFVDPRLRGAVFDPASEKLDWSGGVSISAIRGVVGVASGYMRQDEITDDTVGFLYLAGCHYWGNTQCNLKLMAFSSEESERLDRIRGKIQLGFYDAGVGEEAVFLHRYQISVHLDWERGLGYAQEFGSEVEHWTRGILAATSIWRVAMKRSPDPWKIRGFNVHATGRLHVALLRKRWLRLRGSCSLAYGSDGGCLHQGARCVDLGLEVPMPLGAGTLHLGVGIAYRPSGCQVADGWNNELSVFIGTPVVTRLGRAPVTR